MVFDDALEDELDGTYLSIHQNTVQEQAGQKADWMKEARAVALGFIRGDDSFSADVVFEDLRQAVSTFTDPGGHVALDTLAEHLPILEALWLRLATEAAAERNTERAGRKLRGALLAHAEFSRTLLLVQGLARQKRREAAVTVVCDAGVGGLGLGFDGRE